MLSVSRITAVVAGLAGAALAVILPDIITALTIFYSILSVALFVPLIAGLYSSKPTANGALTTIIGSVLVMIVVQLYTAGVGMGGVSPTTWGIGIAVIIMVLHILSKRKITQ